MSKREGEKKKRKVKVRIRPLTASMMKASEPNLVSNLDSRT